MYEPLVHILRTFCSYVNIYFNLYSVWGSKKFMGKEYGGLLRTTFLIDLDGNIKDVIEKSTLPSTVLICWQKWSWHNQSKLQLETSVTH